VAQHRFRVPHRQPETGYNCNAGERTGREAEEVQGIMRADIMREVAAIAEDEVIMTCVAMGYPDDNFAANAVRSDREGNAEFVRYVGFAD
jgi:hypothetical protein